MTHKNLAGQRKKLVALAAACCCTLQAMTQSLDILGGVNLTGIAHSINGEKQDGSGRVGFHAGIAVFAPFHPKAYKADPTGEGTGLLPTLQYITKGTSKSAIINQYAADIKLGYLQFNLPVAYTAGSFGIGIGPYAALALSGNKKYRVGNGQKESIQFGTEMKRLDYGMGIHLQLPLFRLQYDLGLANLSAASGNTARTRSFSLSIDIPLVD